MPAITNNLNNNISSINVVLSYARGTQGESNIEISNGNNIIHNNNSYNNTPQISLSINKKPKFKIVDLVKYKISCSKTNNCGEINVINELALFLRKKFDTKYSIKFPSQELKYFIAYQGVKDGYFSKNGKVTYKFTNYSSLELLQKTIGKNFGEILYKANNYLSQNLLQLSFLSKDIKQITLKNSNAKKTFKATSPFEVPEVLNNISEYITINNIKNKTIDSIVNFLNKHSHSWDRASHFQIESKTDFSKIKFSNIIKIKENSAKPDSNSFAKIDKNLKDAIKIANRIKIDFKKLDQSIKSNKDLMNQISENEKILSNSQKYNQKIEKDISNFEKEITKKIVNLSPELRAILVYKYLSTNNTIMLKICNYSEG
jgi:hypothetical protein